MGGFLTEEDIQYLDNKKMTDEKLDRDYNLYKMTELNKIKFVLINLWEGCNQPEAKDIINKFKEELDEIEKGN